MAVKSIVDIEINDSAFKDFAATFEKYQAALAKTPKSWEESGKAQRSTVLAFQSIAAALLAQSALQAKRLKALKDEAKTEKESSSYWKDMVRSSREVASNAASIAKSVLSTIGVGSIFSGLLGAGGLYGLDSLAGAVGDHRRRALGLGSTIGETRAFGLNYGRLVDPGSVIGGVNNSLLDVSHISDLYLAGLTQGDLKGKDAAQVASLLISKFKARVDQTNPLLYGSLIKDFGYGNLGLTVQDAERARNTPASEINEYGRAFGRDAKRLNVLDPQAKRFQDFDVQLHRAGEQIENVFIRGISPLIPALTKFSESVVTTATTLADRLIKSGALDKFAGWIEGFAKGIGSKDFQDNVKLFAEDIVTLGKGVHAAIQYFGGLIENKPGPNNPYSKVHASDYPSTPLGLTQWIADRARAGGLGTSPAPSPGTPETPEARGRRRLALALQGFDYSITSDYRSAADNARVLGKPNSAHRIPGAAFDIVPKEGMRSSDVAEIVATLKAQGYFAMPEISRKGHGDHIHVSSIGDRGGKKIPGYGWNPAIGIKIDNNTGGNVVVSANQLRGQVFQ